MTSYGFSDIDALQHQHTCISLVLGSFLQPKSHKICRVKPWSLQGSVTPSFMIQTLEMAYSTVILLLLGADCLTAL